MHKNGRKLRNSYKILTSRHFDWVNNNNQSEPCFYPSQGFVEVLCRKNHRANANNVEAF